MPLSNNIINLGKTNPKLACEAFWKFSHIEVGKEQIEEILVRVGIDSDDLLKTHNLILVAQEIVNSNTENVRKLLSEGKCEDVAKTAEDMKDAVIRIINSSKKYIVDWSLDFSAHGENHPERHCAIADFLARVIRGELLNPENRLHHTILLKLPR